MHMHGYMQGRGVIQHILDMDNSDGYKLLEKIGEGCVGEVLKMASIDRAGQSRFSPGTIVVLLFWLAVCTTYT